MTSSTAHDALPRLEITFDPAFDFGAYPGPEGDAVAGALWLGPAGLLRVLESRLGFAGPRVDRDVRATEVAERLATARGYFERSAEVDPLGTAQRLVADRDALWLHGWRGEPASERVAALAAVTANLAPGTPDRWLAAAQALGKRAVSIGRIELLCERAALPHAMRVCLDALEARGTAVVQRSVVPVEASGDLAGAKSGNSFTPSGDGTLQLIRPCGPVAAAEHIAAWIAARPSRAGVVIIGADELLDRALRDRGLPTTGSGATDHALLEILPLTVAMGWSPPDPALAHALLALPIGPVRPMIARALHRALTEWPAVGSPVWNQKLADALSRLDQTDREPVAARIAQVFATAAARGSAYPVAALTDKTTCIRDWARNRAHACPDEAEALVPVVDQCNALLDRLGRVRAEALPASEIHRCLHAARKSAGTTPPYAAQVGLSSLGRADCIAGPAELVVWWNFDRHTAPSPTSLRLTTAEQRELARLGVALPAPGQEAERLAARWRRPLQLASRAVALVCPQRNAAGDEQFPHPLWDEIAASIPHAARRAGVKALTHEAPARIHPAFRVACKQRPLPSPTHEFSAAPSLLVRPHAQSASAVGTLFGCSFKWALDYRANLRSGHLAEAPTGIEPLLFGSLAHEVFERLLKAAPNMTGSEAEAKATEVLDEVLDSLGHPLLLPGADHDRAETQQRIVRAAGVLFDELRKLDASIHSIEEKKPPEPPDGTVYGTPDLVLKQPKLVIDFKWGSSRYEHLLESGTAVQLAVYASVVADELGAIPELAYFFVRRGELARNLGPGTDEVWATVRRTIDERNGQISSGRVVAPGNPDASGATAPDHPEVQNGRIVLDAPCGYCSYDGLCGAAFGGNA